MGYRLRHWYFYLSKRRSIGLSTKVEIGTLFAQQGKLNIA